MSKTDKIEVRETDKGGYEIRRAEVKRILAFEVSTEWHLCRALREARNTLAALRLETDDTITALRKKCDGLQQQSERQADAMMQWRDRCLKVEAERDERATPDGIIDWLKWIVTTKATMYPHALYHHAYYGYDGWRNRQQPEDEKEYCQCGYFKLSGNAPAKCLKCGKPLSKDSKEGVEA